MRHAPATVTASHMCTRLAQRACPYRGTEANFRPAGLVLEERWLFFFFSCCRLPTSKTRTSGQELGSARFISFFYDRVDKGKVDKQLAYEEANNIVQVLKCSTRVSPALVRHWRQKNMLAERPCSPFFSSVAQAEDILRLLQEHFFKKNGKQKMPSLLNYTSVVLCQSSMFRFVSSQVECFMSGYCDSQLFALVLQ